MRSYKTMSLIFALTSGFLFSTICAAAEKTMQKNVDYGVEIPKSGEIWTLSRAIENLAVVGESTNNKPKRLKISGTITKVCQKKGCWLILTDGDRFARVTFKDYKTFVPTDTGTEPSLILGVLSEKELTASAAKHYAKDAGESTVSVGARREYSIIAEAIRIGART